MDNKRSASKWQYRRRARGFRFLKAQKRANSRNYRNGAVERKRADYDAQGQAVNTSKIKSRRRFQNFGYSLVSKSAKAMDANFVKKSEAAVESSKGDSEMANIIRRSASEYRRQLSAKDAFKQRAEKNVEIMNFAERVRPSGYFGGNGLEQNLLLISFPLFEVAWADGRINGYEQDAILLAADIYGLIDNFDAYSQLTNWMGARTQAERCERVWREISALCLSLNEQERKTILSCLADQAEYVASQSQRLFLGYWRVNRAGERESEALQTIAQRIAQINLAAERQSKGVFTEMKKQIAAFSENENLTRLVPLVKVAWADGQVTKRERHLVFEIAARAGLTPNSDAFKRLESWLEMYPPEDFYESSLEELRSTWQRLPKDERDRRRFNLLADCADLAAASGGSSQFVGGGARVSDEEIHAVKSIARKLGGENPGLN